MTTPAAEAKQGWQRVKSCFFTKTLPNISRAKSYDITLTAENISLKLENLSLKPEHISLKL